MSTDHREGHLNGIGGLSLYWQCWQPQAMAKTGGATIVIAHGLSEHSGRYQRLAEHLVAQGCVVYAIDHRGHGKSEGRRAIVDRFDNAVADLHQLVVQARREQPGRPLLLLGHSMGGALALAYALAHQSSLDGLILSGPAVSLSAAPRIAVAVSGVLSRIAPGMGVASLEPSAVSRDAAEVAAYTTDPLNYHGRVPARTAGEIVGFAKSLPGRLKELTLPILAMHGQADTLAAADGSELVIAGVRSADKTLRLYPGLRHEIFNELAADRAQVFSDLAAWIVARSAVGGAASAKGRSGR